MALTQIVGSDSVKDALKTKANAGFTQTDTNQTEIVNARDGEANLLAKMDALDAAIAAIISGNVAWTQTNKTGDYTLLAADLNGTKVFTNNGASAGVEFTLPAGGASYLVGFQVMEAYALQITADGTEKFRYLGTQTAGGATVESSTVGDYVFARWDGDQWHLFPAGGQWTDGTSALTEFAAPPEIGSITPEVGRIKIKEIIQTATDTLTAAECSGTIINNYGQGAENTQTLPTAAEGLNGIVMIGTTGAGAFHLKAGPTDKIYFDGTALDDADKVSVATPAVGDYFTFFAFKTGASAYDWIVRSGNGTMTDGGA